MGFLSSLAMWATPSLASYTEFYWPIGLPSLVSLALCRRGSQGLSSNRKVSAIARWVSLHSLSMFQSCLKRIFIATKKIANVFNNLLINPLISLINKNAFSIHFI
tara:strand:+ start:842 stop:1156 length:315 start_codon:yes stop_codon:yes gene_type:complete